MRLATGTPGSGRESARSRAIIRTTRTTLPSLFSVVALLSVQVHGRPVVAQENRSNSDGIAQGVARVKEDVQALVDAIEGGGDGKVLMDALTNVERRLDFFELDFGIRPAQAPGWSEVQKLAAGVLARAKESTTPDGAARRAFISELYIFHELSGDVAAAVTSLE